MSYHRHIVYILQADKDKLREIVHAHGNKIGAGQDFARKVDVNNVSVEDKTCPVCIHGFARTTQPTSGPGYIGSLSSRLSKGGLDRGANDSHIMRHVRAAHPDNAYSQIPHDERFVSWETYETLFDWRIVESVDDLRDVGFLGEGQD